ncbi:hypothetical protein MIR68_007521 [Amoeboaphelidium protococcarum]|nr:hypothetical protein MIR68_007521 [Amoeboaphelidium protococcarum]
MQRRRKQYHLQSQDKDDYDEKEDDPTPYCAITAYFATLFIVVTLCLSYIITGSYTWGYELPNFRSKAIQSGYLKEQMLSEDELKQYDGSDPTKPIYLAIDGNVFDVTSGRAHYGPDGGYSFFAGRDAARAYVTGCFKEHLTHDLRGFTRDQLNQVKDWVDFYKSHAKYVYVGKVIHPPTSPDTPIPEDCKKNKKPQKLPPNVS